MKFKIGEDVSWKSEVNGIIIKRKGKIIFIIDSFESLSDIIKSEEFKKCVNSKIHIIHNNLDDFRPAESYLVKKINKNGGRPSLFWPEVNSLRKIRKRTKKKGEE